MSGSRPSDGYHVEARETTGDPEDVIDSVLQWLGEGRSVALATVLDTWGSAPRPVGSQLAVDNRGQFVGSVSGGCVEAATVQAALDVLERGGPKRLQFGVADADAWQVGLACGGTIQILVQDAGHIRGALEQVPRVRARREVAVLAIELVSGSVQLLDLSSGGFEDGNPEGSGLEDGGLDGGDPGGAGTDLLNRTARQAVARDRSAVASVAKQGLAREWFLKVIAPRPRMIVVGAVHIAEVLTQMARLNGFDVVVVDPRSAFAREERFGGAELRVEWPDSALAAFALDERTAVVTLSHDPKIDDPALGQALRSEAFYVGALGSRRTHQTRLERLGAQGYSRHELARIHGPVGLDIGAQSVAEIATSIIAEVIQTLRQDVQRS